MADSEEISPKNNGKRSRDEIRKLIKEAHAGSIEADNELNLLHLVAKARKGSAITKRFLLNDVAKWSREKLEDRELHDAESTIQIIEEAFK